MRNNVKDADIVGINHYRRYFVRMNYLQYLYSFVFDKRSYKLKKVLSADDIQQYFDRGYQCILPKKESKYPFTMKGFFERYHNPQILADARKVLQDLYPEYLVSYDSVMVANRYYLKCICIMKKELFDEYIDWEMSILSKLEAYPWCTGNRELAYLAERLMNVFVEERIVKKGIKVKELYFINTDKSIRDAGKSDMEFWSPDIIKRLVSGHRFKNKEKDR